jgi:hypothetical protein
VTRDRFVSGRQIVGTGAWGAYSLGCLVDPTQLLIAAPVCSAVGATSILIALTAAPILMHLEFGRLGTDSGMSNFGRTPCVPTIASKEFAQQ